MAAQDPSSSGPSLPITSVILPEPAHHPISVAVLPPPGRAIPDAVFASYESSPTTRDSVTGLAIPAVPAHPSAAGSPGHAAFESLGAGVSHFHDAVAVRHAVFVVGQHCGWAEEIDEDDAASAHFVAGLALPPSLAADDMNAERAAAATLRLVRGPHPPHPRPGDELYAGKSFVPDEAQKRRAREVADAWDWKAYEAKKESGARDVKTKMHDGRELYAKLGRVATVDAARGKGVAKRLIEYAMKWAGEHPQAMDRVVVAGGEDKDADVDATWKGLILAHSQLEVAPLYAKCGFVEDPELGRWFEFGIEHVAMWARVEVRRE